jgi:hypothetical protein
MENEREESVEKVLKALGRAQAPEGLEARVAARLVQHPEVVEFRWRDVVAGSAMGGVWWRGAFVGAAVSMLAVGVVMLAGYFVWRPGVHVVREVAPLAAPTRAAVVGVGARNCAGSEMLWASGTGSAQRHDGVRVAIVPGEKLMTAPPLTAEERGLVRLAKDADLKELASLNPEIRERLEAEDAAQFRSFFAEPVKPVAADPAVQPTAVDAAPVAPAAVEPSPVQPAAEPATETVTEPASGENE